MGISIPRVDSVDSWCNPLPIYVNFDIYTTLQFVFPWKSHSDYYEHIYVHTNKKLAKSEVHPFSSDAKIVYYNGFKRWITIVKTLNVPKSFSVWSE